MSSAVILSSSARQGVPSTVGRSSFISKFRKTLSTMASDDSKFYTIGITGSSGLLGTALIDELTQKQDGVVNGKLVRIVKLERSKTSKIETSLEDDNESTMLSLPWAPKVEDDARIIDETALKSMDTIVHLAGDNVGTGLLPGPLGWLGIQAWSEEKKNLITNSRVGPTKALAESIAASKSSTNFITASGVGVYGNDFFEKDEDESASPDESFDCSDTKGFLAELSRQWEAASQPAVKKGDGSNRVVNLRLAPLLSKKGGALGKLFPIFFLGGGGIVGSGKQYFSFISARDAARAIVHTIETPSLTGPVNIIAPTPCTNAGFTKTLGKALSRPTIIPLPEFVVKLMFGEMGEEMLLGGVKATPKKLLDSGFVFQHENIESAIESALKENI